MTASRSQQDFAITDITVVDTRNRARALHRTVMIHEGRIASVDTAAPPQGAIVVAGRGKFLIPGFWDMVTHLSWTRASARPALVANGITAVRDERGDFAEMAIWAEGVRSLRLTGPTILQVGPMLHGKGWQRWRATAPRSRPAFTPWPMRSPKTIPPHDRMRMTVTSHGRSAGRQNLYHRPSSGPCCQDYWPRLREAAVMAEGD